MNFLNKKAIYLVICLINSLFLFQNLSHHPLEALNVGILLNFLALIFNSLFTGIF